MNKRGRRRLFIRSWSNQDGLQDPELEWCEGFSGLLFKWNGLNGCDADGKDGVLRRRMACREKAPGVYPRKETGTNRK
jgi:hypothetical protein